MAADPVTNATAKSLVKEIKRATELLESVIVGADEPVSEEQVPEDFTFTAGPAFDKPVFRVEVHGPVDDTSNVFLRRAGAVTKLTKKRPSTGVLIGETRLGPLAVGTWEAVFEHNGEELRTTTVELIP
jgi:hypothetical protein